MEDDAARVRGASPKRVPQIQEPVAAPTAPPAPGAAVVPMSPAIVAASARALWGAGGVRGRVAATPPSGDDPRWRTGRRRWTLAPDLMMPAPELLLYGEEPAS